MVSDLPCTLTVWFKGPLACSSVGWVHGALLCDKQTSRFGSPSDATCEMERRARGRHVRKVLLTALPGCMCVLAGLQNALVELRAAAGRRSSMQQQGQGRQQGQGQGQQQEDPSHKRLRKCV